MTSSLLHPSPSFFQVLWFLAFFLAQLAQFPIAAATPVQEVTQSRRALSVTAQLEVGKEAHV